MTARLLYRCPKPGVRAFAMVMLTLLACACAPLPFVAGDEHARPLPGMIWDVNGGRMVAREVLLEAASGSHFVLLGEIHDNPEQHRLQGEVLHALLARGKRPALAMEQLDRENQPAIDAARAAPGASADTVATAGKLDREGWTWSLYEPLLRAAVDARLPVVALNLPRNRAREVARQGFAALGPTAARDLALESTWNAERKAVMDRDIVDGHCGKLPAAMLPRMVDMQRARDAVMADALLDGLKTGAVAIAGKGHVRKDVGIPVYLAARSPQARVLSIGFLEVDPDGESVGDYVRPPAQALPFDYVWFTTAAEREDPCKDLTMPNRP